jgi:peptidyl-prolyl isomerase E (cyclophilin E)
MSAINNEDRSKKTVWISGLDDLVSLELLKSACIIFGDILDISLPLDNKTGKHRGFAFIEFEESQDAKECVDNLHGAELLGKTVTAKISKSAPQLGGTSSWNINSWVDGLEQVEVE